MLVGLAGFAGSGKDTAAQALVAQGFRQDAFAATLKSMALACDPYIRRVGISGIPFYTRLSTLVSELDWEGAKQIAGVREFLQRLGTEAVRHHLGDGTWVKALAGRWEAAGRPDTVVTDVRFENEALWVLCPFQGASAAEHITIWIDRPGVGPVNGHSSDQGLVRPFCTHTIVNDGSVEQLHQKVIEVITCRI